MYLKREQGPRKINSIDDDKIESLLNKINHDGDRLKAELPKSTNERTSSISNLQQAYQDEDLTFVLGAGISVAYNVPSWDELLQHLLIDTINNDSSVSDALSQLFTATFQPGSLIAGRYLQQAYDIKGTHSLEFEEKVRKILYQNIEDDFESDFMAELMKFCIAAGKSPNIDSIISYNYDDIVETSLQKKDLGILFRSIYGVGMNPLKGEIPIYHVHGFLPRDQTLGSNNKITLGENVYHQQYMDTYSWNNLVQLNKLRENTCFFIGISLTDPNMRRLLDIANTQKGYTDKSHYLIKKRYEIDWIKSRLDVIIKDNDILKMSKIAANLNVDQTAKLLKDIIESFEENDLESFGVKSIWIDDFDEIPQIMNEIRTLK